MKETFKALYPWVAEAFETYKTQTVKTQPE